MSKYESDSKVTDLTNELCASQPTRLANIRIRTIKEEEISSISFDVLKALLN